MPQEFINQLNRWGKEKTPFLFIIDFEAEKPLAFPISKVDVSEVLFDFNGYSNSPHVRHTAEVIKIKTHPISFEEYQNKFEFVYRRLKYGDSFLTNLTISTPITINKSLNNLFAMASAKYKLLYKDEFLVFSPETFVKMEHGKIITYPMKGTINASVRNATQTILKDEKEKAEHVTIVDLIRNDLSLVSKNVTTTNFRYIDRINTIDKTLLQVSSEIKGDLAEDWPEHIGNILFALLPAGSVSGAPKNRTLEIIRLAEVEKRGYYTGVMGFFDGEKLDSGVMIRFIEKQGNNFFYRSGGGITAQSNCRKEYEEALTKIYVPVI
jgi:para-aminobenzoate synthetase component I